jgi:diaminopimelate epimerase
LNYSGEKGQLYAAASKLQTFSCEGSTGINLHVISEHKPSTKNIKGLAELGHKDVWVWERGVGPTKACGSGACVVGAHSYLEMEAEFGQWVEIKMPGGLLWTRQKEASGEIELMGPAEMSFAGELYL